MRPKGSAEALEMRRMIAARMLQQGKGIREVSRSVGVSAASVSRWNKVLQDQGSEALRAKPHPGKPPRLTPEQKERLAEILRQGAKAAGFPTELWTLRRVAQVIERESVCAITRGGYGTSFGRWVGVPRSQNGERGSETRRPSRPGVNKNGKR